MTACNTDRRALSSLSIRRQAIVRLLETSLDGLPEPSRQSHVAAGFVDGARSRTCPDCLANGRVLPTCETCHGSGVVEGRRLAMVAAPDVLADDDSTRDPYKRNDVKQYGLDGARHDATHARDREIDRLAGQLRGPRSEAELMDEANREPYAWERERARMYRRFDYAHLDVALEQLRQHDPVAYRALHAVYVYGWLHESISAADVACERGLAFLSPRLAVVELRRGVPLRAPDAPKPPVNFAARGRGADARALFQRDEDIRRAVLDAKIPTADVARTWGLSVSQVNRIVSKAA